jgi:hypothetical protein
MSSPKSKHVEDKPVFLKELAECPRELIELFRDLKKKSINDCECDDWGYTDKPDFRLGCCEQLLCELVLKPRERAVLIRLRVDGDYPRTMVEGLKNIQVRDGRNKPGLRWIEYVVDRKHQIDEATALIREVYRLRTRNGWSHHDKE